MKTNVFCLVAVLLIYSGCTATRHSSANDSEPSRQIVSAEKAEPRPGDTVRAVPASDVRIAFAGGTSAAGASSSPGGTSPPGPTPAAATPRLIKAGIEPIEGQAVDSSETQQLDGLFATTESAAASVAPGSDAGLQAGRISGSVFRRGVRRLPIAGRDALHLRRYACHSGAGRE